MMLALMPSLRFADQIILIKFKCKRLYYHIHIALKSVLFAAGRLFPCLNVTNINVLAGDLIISSRLQEIISMIL